MAYVTSLERISIKKGRLNMAREDILEVLAVRFDQVPPAVREAVDQVSDLEVCKRLLQDAIRSESMEAFEEQLREVDGSGS